MGREVAPTSNPFSARVKVGPVLVVVGQICAIASVFSCGGPRAHKSADRVPAADQILGSPRNLEHEEVDGARLGRRVAAAASATDRGLLFDQKLGVDCLPAPVKAGRWVCAPARPLTSYLDPILDANDDTYSDAACTKNAVVLSGFDLGARWVAVRHAGDCDERRLFHVVPIRSRTFFLKEGSRCQERSLPDEIGFLFGALEASIPLAELRERVERIDDELSVLWLVGDDGSRFFESFLLTQHRSVRCLPRDVDGALRCMPGHESRAPVGFPFTPLACPGAIEPNTKFVPRGCEPPEIVVRGRRVNAGDLPTFSRFEVGTRRLVERRAVHGTVSLRLALYDRLLGTTCMRRRAEDEVVRCLPGVRTFGATYSGKLPYESGFRQAEAFDWSCLPRIGLARCDRAEVDRFGLVATRDPRNQGLQVWTLNAKRGMRQLESELEPTDCRLAPEDPSSPWRWVRLDQWLPPTSFVEMKDFVEGPAAAR